MRTPNWLQGQKLFLKLFLLNLACPAFVFAEESLEWQSTKPLLQQAEPAAPQFSSPMLRSIRGIFLRSLTHPESLKAVVEIQNAKGNKPAAYTSSVLLPKGMANGENDIAGIRSEISKTMAKGVQRETKITDFIPKEFIRNLTFKLGGSKAQAPAAPQDQLRYGLILTDIEPSAHSLKLASINTDSDYEMLRYAGKADLRYQVGPLPAKEGMSLYQMASPSVERNWYDLDNLPRMEFDGKLTPAGLPSAKSPLPPQLITLQQSQGYYSIEAKIEKTISPDSAIHRFRVPVYQSMNYREERNKDFEINKVTLENLYVRGPFSCNLEDQRIEKRYQAGLLYTKDSSRIELYTRADRNAIGDKFWPHHSWELKLETSF